MESSAEPQKTAVCPGCAHLNFEAAHFCEKCGAPLTAYAWTAPFESTLARGFAFRNSVTTKPSLFVLSGIWLTMLPMALVSGLALFTSLLLLALAIRHRQLAEFIGAAFASGACFVLFWISAGITLRVTRNYLFGVPSTAAGTDSTPAGGPSRHATSESDSTTCLSCGAPMSEADDACAACGWSYDDAPPE